MYWKQNLILYGFVGHSMLVAAEPTTVATEQYPLFS
jgi:hypothetical protein